MRDLTKSMFSFSWAMSLFGIQQALNLFSPVKATKAFNEVTQAAEEEFGEALKAGFRAGDGMQRGFVDLTMRVLSGSIVQPLWVSEPRAPMRCDSQRTPFNRQSDQPRIPFNNHRDQLASRLRDLRW